MEGKTTICCHAFSSDATNSAVWQNAKSQGCELQSAYVVLDERSSPTTLNSQTMTKKGWSDVQRFACNSGECCHAILIKQLTNCGCPTWEKENPILRGGLQPLRVFCYGSDAGPDQMKFQRYAAAECEFLKSTLLIGSRCFMHQTQLDFKSGLALLDRWAKTYNKFYSGLANSVIVGVT